MNKGHESLIGELTLMALMMWNTYNLSHEGGVAITKDDLHQYLFVPCTEESAVLLLLMNANPN